MQILRIIKSKLMIIKKKMIFKKMMKKEVTTKTTSTIGSTTMKILVILEFMHVSIKSTLFATKSLKLDQKKSIYIYKDWSKKNETGLLNHSSGSTEPIFTI